MSILRPSAFDSCQLKVITYRENGKNNVDVSPGVEATLRCPKLDGDSISETDEWNVTQKGAYRKVGRTATKTLCKACPFVGMSPLQANALQREIASSEMDALQAKAMAEQMQTAYAQGKDIVTDSHVWQNPSAPQVPVSHPMPELPPFSAQ